MGQTDYFTGLKTLNKTVLQPPSPHQYNNYATIVSQGCFIARGEKNSYMGDYFDNMMIFRDPDSL